MMVTQYAHLCLSCWGSMQPMESSVNTDVIVLFHVLRSLLPFSAALAMSASHCFVLKHSFVSFETSF